MEQNFLEMLGIDECIYKPKYKSSEIFKKLVFIR